MSDAKGAIPPTTTDPELQRVARRVCWWMPVDEALQDPLRLVAQVMTFGTWVDVQTIRRCLGAAVFEAVLDAPPPGVFTARRWNFWHVRLKRLPAPPLPKRKLS